MTRFRITRAGSATAVMLMIAVCAAVLSFGALAEIGNSAARRVNLFGIEPPYAGYIWAATSVAPQGIEPIRGRQTYALPLAVTRPGHTADSTVARSI